VFDVQRTNQEAQHGVAPPGDTDESRQAWIYTIKSRPCEQCGRSFSPRKMEFHHRDPAEKAFTIGVGRGRTCSALLVEMAKCDVLCRGCHVEVHRAAQPAEDISQRDAPVAPQLLVDALVGKAAARGTGGREGTE
jgi:hypothetical protein